MRDTVEVNIYRTLRSVLQFGPVETDATKRRLASAANIDDLRTIAKRRLPAGVFDYIDGAAEDEVTARRNVLAFQDYEFRPRVLQDVSQIDPSVDVLGVRSPLPLILSPTGFTRLAHPLGERAVARAAARAGLPYTLSTMSTVSIEDVGAVSTGRTWFQVYTWKDRGLVKEMLDRASVSGYEAIMVTVDTAVLGRRERDVRRGFTMPPKLGLGTLIDGAKHPAWTWSFARSEPITFANLVGTSENDGSGTAINLGQHTASQFQPALSWADVSWFQDNWSGPIILKGIQRVDDAVTAAKLGVAAVALSNHGGRQLDGAPAPIDLVGPVAQAIGGQVEIYCDGGIRRGSDIVKARALGATACMIGRAYLFGLAAGGEAGVDHVLSFFDEGVRRTMALTGNRTMATVTDGLVHRRG